MNNEDKREKLYQEIKDIQESIKTIRLMNLFVDRESPIRKSALDDLQKRLKTKKAKLKALEEKAWREPVAFWYQPLIVAAALVALLLVPIFWMYFQKSESDKEKSKPLVVSSPKPKQKKSKPILKDLKEQVTEMKEHIESPETLVKAQEPLMDTLIAFKNDRKKLASTDEEESEWLKVKEPNAAYFQALDENMHKLYRVPINSRANLR